ILGKSTYFRSSKRTAGDRLSRKLVATVSFCRCEKVNEECMALTYNPKVVAVLGLGTMGQGIALVCALADFETHVFDVDPALAGKAKGQMMAKLVKLGEREKRSP